MNPKDKRTDARLRKTYGITLKDYNRMLKAQKGGCWICGRKSKSRRLHIDHDHKTGKVRGLLCMAHNYALGRRGFSDNIEHLRLAVVYLEKEIPNQTGSPSASDRPVMAGREANLKLGCPLNKKEKK